MSTTMQPQQSRRLQTLRNRRNRVRQQDQAAVMNEPAHLVFSLGGLPYACPISDIETIVRSNDVQRLPGDGEDPGWWAGVMKSGLQHTPILSLRNLWGIDERAGSDEQSALLVFRSGGDRLALDLDACLGVVKALPPKSVRMPVPPEFSPTQSQSFGEIMPWHGQLLLTVRLDQIVPEDIRTQTKEILDMKYRPVLQDSQLLDFRIREAKLSKEPSVEGYLKLAGDYGSFGLRKESERLIRVAEDLESGNTSAPSEHLFAGTADPTMLCEVLQILSRTQRTGDLVVETPAQTYHVILDTGRVINATCMNQGAGQPSFQAALSSRQGSYRFIEKDVAGTETTITDSTEALLLTTLHDIDQGARA